MANYIDNFNIDHSRIIDEVNDWKLKLEKEIKSKINPKHQLRRIILASFSAIFLIGAIIYLILVIANELSSLHETLIIIVVLILGIFLISLIIIETKEKKRITKEVKNFVSNNEMFENWFSKIFDHEEISDKYKSMFGTSDDEISFLVNKYKYKPAGNIKVGVDSTYNIMGGKIFNNPFNLACGIYYSYTKTKKWKTKFYEYMPILQIKTDAFKNLNLFVTNSKKFKGYQKNTIKFDNLEFGEKFLIKSNNNLETMMIFSPLIQEKWISALHNLPRFQMHLKNGMINILFQGSNSKHSASTKPFMSIENLFRKSWTIKSFFKTLDRKVIDNLKIFSQILNIIFAISYFQWEDSTNEKKNINISNSKTLLENIKKNIDNNVL